MSVRGVLQCIAIGVAVAALSCCATSANFPALYNASLQANTLILQQTHTAAVAKLITPAQETKVLQVSDAVQSVLNAAELAYTGADSATANTDLAKAAAVIASLGACLTAPALSVAGFDSCSATIIAPVAQ